MGSLGGLRLSAGGSGPARNMWRRGGVVYQEEEYLSLLFVKGG